MSNGRVCMGALSSKPAFDVTSQAYGTTSTWKRGPAPHVCPKFQLYLPENNIYFAPKWQIYCLNEEMQLSMILMKQTCTMGPFSLIWKGETQTFQLQRFCPKEQSCPRDTSHNMNNIEILLR